MSRSTQGQATTEDHPPRDDHEADRTSQGSPSDGRWPNLAFPRVMLTSPWGSSRNHPRRRFGRQRRSLMTSKERNFPAAVSEAIVIATLCTAMAETQWFSLRGGGCNHGSPSSLGVYQFFYVGNFIHTAYKVDDSVHKPTYVYQYSSNINDRLINCVDAKSVQILRSIVILCFLGVVCSLFAFILDLLGPRYTVLKFMRRNAIWSIVTVIICVTVNGFCFWVSQRVLKIQSETKPHTGSKVLVRFDIGFYLVAAAGAVAVLASGCNCLRRYPVYDRERNEHLLDDYDGLDTFMSPVPPPPAYSP